ncbi:hypothetical protein [Streptomyces sp. BH104]|uniref:hypothetical protein n=1 Tax=Streptomyces sp. BH104 TaxID=3410407 RepID=UPI003BB4DB9C
MPGRESQRPPVRVASPRHGILPEPDSSQQPDQSGGCGQPPPDAASADGHGRQQESDQQEGDRKAGACVIARPLVLLLDDPA